MPKSPIMVVKHTEALGGHVPSSWKRKTIVSFFKITFKDSVLCKVRFFDFWISSIIFFITPLWMFLWATNDKTLISPTLSYNDGLADKGVGYVSQPCKDSYLASHSYISCSDNWDSRSGLTGSNSNAGTQLGLSDLGCLTWTSSKWTEHLKLLIRASVLAAKCDKSSVPRRSDSYKCARKGALVIVSPYFLTEFSYIVFIQLMWKHLLVAMNQLCCFQLQAAVFCRKVNRRRVYYIPVSHWIKTGIHFLI